MADNKISKAPPPIPTLPNSAPHLPGLDLANALQRISKMSDREKADLSIDAARKNVLARDYRTVKPDAKHWALEVDWAVDDAALLLVDLDPREGLGLRLKEYLADSSEDLLKSTLKRDELALFRHAETIIRRANGTNSTLPKKYALHFEDIIGKLGVWITTPSDFVAWASQWSPVPVPAWMKALAGETERDRLAREQQQLETENRKLREDLDATEGRLVLALAEIEQLRAENERLILREGERKRKRPSKIIVANMKEAYDSLARPSKRQVAEITGYDRNTPEFNAAYDQIDAEAIR